MRAPQATKRKAETETAINRNTSEAIEDCIHTEWWVIMTVLVFGCAVSMDTIEPGSIIYMPLDFSYVHFFLVDTVTN